MATSVFYARSAQANLIKKTDFDAKLNQVVAKRLLQTFTCWKWVEKTEKNLIQVVLLAKVILKLMVNTII